MSLRSIAYFPNIILSMQLLCVLMVEFLAVGLYCHAFSDRRRGIGLSTGFINHNRLFPEDSSTTPSLLGYHPKPGYQLQPLWLPNNSLQLQLELNSQT
jgi:hypothetical protein